MKNILLNAATDVNYLDNIIGVTIILLILSLITEKFVELIRKYISIRGVKLLRNINKNTEDDADLEKKKKTEISVLAVIVGVIVAVLSHASLFDLLSADSPQEILFWRNDFKIDFLFILGVLFTGFFLSFGSSFFHDLLDTLYQSKEYKRKLNNKETFEQNTAAAVTEFVETDSFVLAKIALARHGKQLKEKYSKIIESLEIGNTVSNQIGIIVNLKKNCDPPIDFPKSVAVKLANGKSVKIEVEAIKHEIGESQYGLECRLQNPDYYGITGALGGVLVSSGQYGAHLLLTASHVALGGSSENLNGYAPNGNFGTVVEVGENTNVKAIGRLIYSKLDSTNDTAIIELEDNNISDWNNELPDGNFFGTAISVKNLDLNDDITFYSSLRNQFVHGTIHKRSSKIPILLEFGDLNFKSFNSLIVVGDNYGGYWSPISRKGDSGSILFDKNHNPFGLIIGGGDQFTYAIPLLEILNVTKTEILQS